MFKSGGSIGDEYLDEELVFLCGENTFKHFSNLTHQESSTPGMQFSLQSKHQKYLNSWLVEFYH